MGKADFISVVLSERSESKDPFRFEFPHHAQGYGFFDSVPAVLRSE